MIIGVPKEIKNNECRVGLTPKSVSALSKNHKVYWTTSKKIKYYAYENEEPQTVYEFNGNKKADKPLGTREKNNKGKYKVQLFSL